MLKDKVNYATMNIVAYTCTSACDLQEEYIASLILIVLYLNFIILYFSDFHWIGCGCIAHENVTIVLRVALYINVTRVT